MGSDMCEDSLADGISWRQALLPADATIEQAIRNLVETGLQIVLVATPDGVLQGTVTDGDIRRGFLRGVGMDSPVGRIVHRNAFVVPPSMEKESVLKLMEANHLFQVPIVDAERRIIGLHRWDRVTMPIVRPNQMLIMAGGQGSRMRPRTNDCPKPMLPVAGKPMLEHIIDRAKAEGFTDFVIAVHYLGHIIEEYFGDGARWQVQLRYIREETPLGTAGAVGLLDPRPVLPIVVSNGDVLTDVNYGKLLDFHNRHDAAATMAVRLHEWQHPFGVVKTQGIEITGFEEKPISRSHVNAGIYSLDPIVFDMIPSGTHCDMPALFERVAASGKRTVVYPMHEPWLDIGGPLDYEIAQTRGVKDS
jgi:dTDP-glucose pyrophosphorylase